MRLESVISARNSLILTELHSVGMTHTRRLSQTDKFSNIRSTLGTDSKTTQTRFANMGQCWPRRHVCVSRCKTRHPRKLATHTTNKNPLPTPLIKTHHPRYQSCLAPWFPALSTCTFDQHLTWRANPIANTDHAALIPLPRLSTAHRPLLPMVTRKFMANCVSLQMHGHCNRHLGHSPTGTTTLLTFALPLTLPITWSSPRTNYQNHRCRCWVPP